jgi:hypothetical protein
VPITLPRRNLILLAAGACVSALLEPLNSQAQTGDKTPVPDPRRVLGLQRASELAL